MKQLYLTLLLAALQAAGYAQIVYVDKNATGAHDGSSWANAYPTLTEAVDAANASTTIREIRLAANTSYTGDQYFIHRSYDLSGGWQKASNTQAVTQAEATVLDGELTHRIMNIVAGVTARISGLHFTRGGNIADNGGGLHTAGNVIVDHCFFSDNKVIARVGPPSFPGGNPTYTTSDDIGNGGALCNRGTLTVSNSYFSDNWAAGTAGAIANRGTITITGCVIRKSYAYWNGGGVFNYQGARMKINKCRFEENKVDERVGFVIIINGGGGALDNKGPECEVVNSVFYRNRSHGGGAIHNWENMSIRNCSFYANEIHQGEAKGAGGAVLADFTGAVTHVLNCLFWNNLSSYSANHSLYINGGSFKNNSFPAGTALLTGAVDNTDNLNSDPLWVDAANGDFHLAANSPVINKGNNDYSLVTDEPGDFYGQLRISPCVIDMGAVEYQLVGSGFQPDVKGILYVDKASTYNTFGDKGSAWNKALPSLASAVLFANNCASVREIHVAQGTYQESPLTPERGYIIKGSYDPATNTRHWKDHPTIIALRADNTSGQLMTSESIGDKRPITLDGLVFQNATKTALINYPNTELIIANCAFYRNGSNSSGGAISSLGTIRLFNSVFEGNNSSVSGGAIANKGTCFLVNTTFNNNTAPSLAGKAIYNDMSGTLKIQNSIINGPSTAYAINNAGTLELNHNLIMGVAGGTPTYVNNKDTDQFEGLPGFIDAANGDLRLAAGSPAINKGSNALYEAADGNTGNTSTDTDVDMAGLARVYDDVIDLGAYERPMKQQSLAVADIIATYGDAPVEPTITSNTTQPINYPTGISPVMEIFTDIDTKQKIRFKNKGVVSLTVSQAGNAVYDPSPAVTFAITVNPKPVSVTADAQSKVYGEADPTLDYAVAPALVAGDAFTGALSRAAGEAVGQYAIGQGSLLLNDNYLLTYTPADLTIQHKAIAVTLDAKSKTYGEADPALTYSFAPALAFNDVFGGALSRTAGEDAGTYAIQNGLTLNPNYTVTTTGASLVINPKAITVTAADKRKTYSDPDPALTYAVTPGLVGTDVLSGAITRTSGEDAGTYPITQGSLANTNYTISFVPAQLVIDKAAQQITWNQSLLSACDGSTTMALTAASSSGLPVAYQSANAAVASVSNNQLTILTPGLTTITATQAGNHNYLPAASVSQPLTARLSAHLLVRRWNDVLVFDNHSNDFNGWQWYKNGQAINGATGQYLYESGQLNGEYYAIAQNRAGESLPTCPVTLTPGTTATPLTVFPNPTGPGQPVTIKTTYSTAQLQGATLVVTNNTGAVVSTIHQVNPQTTLTMPLIQGLYVVRLQLTTGVTHAVNVLVKP